MAMMTMRSGFGLLVLAALAAGGVFAGRMIWLGSARAADPGTPPAVPVTTAVATIEDVPVLP